MKIATSKVHVLWLFALIIVLGAGLLLWKVAVLDAPPTNSVLIVRGAPRQATDEGVEQGAIGKAAVTIVAGAASDLAVVNSEVTATVPTPTVALPIPSPTSATISVYVSGAVTSPGVFTLPEGARVADALRAAGGAAEDADMDRINLAARVADEEQVAVPRKGEPTVVAQAPKSGQSVIKPTRTPRVTPSPALAALLPGQKLNLNTATAPELEALPGIGPTLAQRILDYRRVYGPFREVEDLKQVSGIGDAILNRLLPYLTVGP